MTGSDRLFAPLAHDRERCIVSSDHREIAHGAAANGFTTLYGSCDGVVNAPYQPFVEALVHLVAEGDPAALREGIGTTVAPMRSSG